jgi:hypothetical protein
LFLQICSVFWKTIASIQTFSNGKILFFKDKKVQKIRSEFFLYGKKLKKNIDNFLLKKKKTLELFFSKILFQKLSKINFKYSFPTKNLKFFVKNNFFERFVRFNFTLNYFWKISRERISILPWTPQLFLFLFIYNCS